MAATEQPGDDSSDDGAADDRDGGDKDTAGKQDGGGRDTARGER